jgi:predicted metalloendopeptidase
MTLAEIKKEFPYIDWLTYMNDILPKDLQINDDEVILVYVKSYFEELGQILKDTPKRAMANYFMWRITQVSLPYLNRQLKYKMDVSGTKDVLPRWIECINIITSSLPTSVDGLYIRQYFREDAKHAATEMVGKLKLAFKNILQTVEWMDAVSREQALQKLEAMGSYIGYPDALWDDEKLDEYYKGLDINSTSFLQSILQINKFNDDKYYSKLRKPIKRANWPGGMNVAKIGARYNLFRNGIGE